MSQQNENSFNTDSPSCCSKPICCFLVENKQWEFSRILTVLFQSRRPSSKKRTTQMCAYKFAKCLLSYLHVHLLAAIFVLMATAEAIVLHGCWLNFNLFLTYTYHMTLENFEFMEYLQYIMVHFRGQHFQIVFTFIILKNLARVWPLAHLGRIDGWCKRYCFKLINQ